MANLFLITTFVILVVAHAEPNNENEYNPFRGFPFGQFPFSNINFPPVRFPQFHPIIPQFPPINIPSPQDIINKNPRPGESFNGIVVQSSSGYTTDEKGNIVKTDGTTVLTNENGVLKEYKVGSNPPDIKSNIVPPFKHPKITIEEGTRPEINLSKIPKIVLPKLPDINIPGFIHISGIQLPTIDFSQLPDIPASKYTAIKITEVPDTMPLIRLFFPHIELISLNNDNVKNVEPPVYQDFFDSSSSSFSISSNVNGKKNYAGASKTLTNNNGQVDEQAVIVENNMI